MHTIFISKDNLFADISSSSVDVVVVDDDDDDDNDNNNMSSHISDFTKYWFFHHPESLVCVCVCVLYLFLCIFGAPWLNCQIILYAKKNIEYDNGIIIKIRFDNLNPF